MQRESWDDHNYKYVRKNGMMVKSATYARARSKGQGQVETSKQRRGHNGHTGPAYLKVHLSLNQSRRRPPSPGREEEVTAKEGHNRSL